MKKPASPSLRALRDLAAVAAASLAAASIWATGLPEEGFLLDAQAWQEQVVDAAGSRWPADGWVRLLPREDAIEVQAVRPDAVPPPEPQPHALYARLPGSALQVGTHPLYRWLDRIAAPRAGTEYELSLGRTRFALQVDGGAAGVQYAIHHGGETYRYVLGPPEAEGTTLRAIADLDGDARPDFLVDVGGQALYLLLSSRARPGLNTPTAQLWMDGC